MKIRLEMRAQYGVKRYYATEIAQAVPLAYLTGTKTLTKSHIDALLALGIEVLLVKMEGIDITPQPME